MFVEIFLWKSDFPEENPHHISRQRHTQLVSQWPTKVLPAELSHPGGVQSVYTVHPLTVHHYALLYLLQWLSFCNTTLWAPGSPSGHTWKIIRDVSGVPPASVELHWAPELGGGEQGWKLNTEFWPAGDYWCMDWHLRRVSTSQWTALLPVRPRVTGL